MVPTPASWATSRIRARVAVRFAGGIAEAAASVAAFAGLPGVRFSRRSVAPDPLAAGFLNLLE